MQHLRLLGLLGLFGLLGLLGLRRLGSALLANAECRQRLLVVAAVAVGKEALV